MANEFFNLPISGSGIKAESPLQNVEVSDFTSRITELLAGQRSIASTVAAAKPTDPVTAPVFAKVAENFGVMRHVDPVRDHLVTARAGIDFLRVFAKSRGAGDAAPPSLLTRVGTYLEEQYKQGFLTLPERREVLDQLGVDPKDDLPLANGLDARLFRTEFPKVGEPMNVVTENVYDKTVVSLKDHLPGGIETKFVKHNSHSALFRSGAVVTEDIKGMELLRRLLTNVRRRQQKRQEDLQADIDALDRRIVGDTTALAALESRRAETLDDYQVARRLVLEHWREVESAHAERRRILEDNAGLWYVKVRETPVSTDLPDPLALRSASPGDLVPGCEDEERNLPEDLAPFLEAVQDLPFGNWNALRDLHPLLPAKNRLEILVRSNRQRIESRLTSIPRVPAGTMAGILAQNRGFLSQVALMPFDARSLRGLQTQSMAILSVEDLMACHVPALRVPAQILFRRLQAAAGCLLERLRAVSPSIRLAWADAAEAGRLDVKDVGRWPGLGRAEASDFNNTRTLVDLVAWLFRQLHAEASSAAYAALGNLVRACVLLAAGEDPEQLLQGKLQSLPGLFRPGEVVRVTLNRQAPLGAMLQLMDIGQRVVGTLRVDDHDEGGTVASIVGVINPGAVLSPGLLVSGKVR